MKQRNYLAIMTLSGLMILSFQNCGQNNFEFGSTNGKVGDGAVDDTIVICTDSLDCDAQTSNDTMDMPSDPDSGTTSNTPGGTGGGTTTTGGTTMPPSSSGSDGTCKHDDDDDNEYEYDKLTCDGYSASNLIDAVINVNGVILFNENSKVSIAYQGEVSLNGFEIEVPAGLQGAPVSVALSIAESGHYFVTKDGSKIAMDSLTGLKSSQRAFRINATSTPDGAYLISADWSSRLHPGKNHCGLLPIKK